MAELLWAGPSAQSAIINGVTVNDAAGSLSSEYDNETNKHTMASLELSFQHSTSPTAGTTWLAYLLYAIDGTNYEDGGTSTQPQKVAAATFPVRAVTTAQKVTVVVPVQPFKFKVLVWNDTGISSSSSSVTLDMEVYGLDDGS